MKLLSFCDPVFQTVFDANSDVQANKHDRLKFASLRSTFKEAITKLDAALKERPEIYRNFRRVRPALIYFIDEFVLQSKLPDGTYLPCHAQWVAQPLANELLPDNRM